MLTVVQSPYIAMFRKGLIRLFPTLAQLQSYRTRHYVQVRIARLPGERRPLSAGPSTTLIGLSQPHMREVLCDLLS